VITLRQTPLGVPSSFPYSPAHLNATLLAHQVALESQHYGLPSLAVTSDSTFSTTASSKVTPRVYLPLEDLDYQPSSLTNPHIHVISADNPRNKYGHTCLLFAKEGLKNFPIVRHQGRWYELYRTKDTNAPFLGPFQPEVHATDLQVDLVEEKTGSEDDPETETEDEPTQQDNLQSTSVVIDPEGPGSPHRED
jgi:hypothetical protein